MDLPATRQADIMIVGEAWGEQEALECAPFVGSSGHILNGCLLAANIDRSSCYLTNVFNLRPRGNDIKNLCGGKETALPGYRALIKGKFVRDEFKPEIDRLLEEIAFVNPKVIIALGNTALWAICKKVGIKKYRGTPLKAWHTDHKVIPTWHPAAVMRMWSLRPIVIADLMKAKRQSFFPEIIRPQREIWIEPTLEDIETFYNLYIAPAQDISTDIETKSETITEIGFAPDPHRAIVIPFYDHTRKGNYWATFEEERAAWNWVRRILKEKGHFGQNFQYDMIYLWQKMGMTIGRFADDTMLLHHAMQPEMEKGLGFLGSIYTEEPSWKFMRTDHSTLKREDD